MIWLYVFNFFVKMCLANETYLVTSLDKPQFLRTHAVNGVRITETCSNEKPCKAFHVAQGRAVKPPVKVDSQGYAISSSSLLCKQLKGIAVIAIDPQRNQVDFCILSDGSFVSTSDLMAHATRR